MYKKPKFRFFLVLSAIFAVLVILSPQALAKSVTESRYFIFSQNPLVKALFGVQHEFKNGFTADLTSGEVWTLQKLFRVEVSGIPLYEISQVDGNLKELVPVAAVSGPDLETALSRERASQEKEILKILARPRPRGARPESAVPWGVLKVYGVEELAATSGGKDVNVAVLDTGVYTKHLDLAGRVADCKDFTRGVVPRSICDDKNGHGTHVAGTVAADGGLDTLGIWGVASEANLFVYKTCRNDGTCWADDIASAIKYAAANKANIISMSFGGNVESILIKEAVADAAEQNVLMVAAAGNDGPEKGSIDWPAGYVEVISVSAIDQDEIVPDWSSRGLNDGDFVREWREVELSAPGINVESTWLDGGYRYFSGTSMAASHISGLAAKLWDGSATNTRLTIQNLARDIWTPGNDIATGWGLPALRTQ